MSIWAIIAFNDWNISLFDFHSAYLSGEHDKAIYTEQPAHYATADWKYYIIKTVYSLKQARKELYDSVCHLLADICPNQTDANPSVFCAHAGNNIYMLLCNGSKY